VLTVGGLFSGIGGWELGLERAGLRVMWHCEADPFAQGVLARWFPGDPVYDDVCGLRGDDVEPVDVLCGGFPCQAVSHNGHGLVQGDERWLWPEFARLVRELRPRYVLVENVAALVGRGLNDVLTDLAAAGYDAEWRCLRASDVGAPHRRERLFLVAYPQRVGCQEGPRVFARELGEDLPQSASWCGLFDRDVDGSLRLVPPPDVQRVADGLPDQLDRLRAVGNALVPQIAEIIGRRIVAYEEGRLDVAA
jgi:DNA (cytosine-5)-methyltransferase 1